MTEADPTSRAPIGDIQVDLSQALNQANPTSLHQVAHNLMMICGEGVNECEIANGIVIKRTSYKLLPYVVEMNTPKSHARIFISEKGEAYTNSRLDDVTFKVKQRTMSVLETPELQNLDFEGEFYLEEIFKTKPEGLEEGILVNVPTFTKGSELEQPQEEIQRILFKKVDTNTQQYFEFRNALLHVSSISSSQSN